MVYLIDTELSFIERKAGAHHIARKLDGSRRWYTYCGRAWHRQEVSEWTARESGPDVSVCRACQNAAPDGKIRVED